ncbi:MAG: hypothetical protein JNL58_01025 [Planctomyces sp.]|nr:hypothetical protein [Planctomyces sp.]
MARSKNNNTQKDSGNHHNASRKRNAEPARSAPDTERGLTHSPYFNGLLYKRMSEDLHLGGMSKRTHEGYLRGGVGSECALNGKSHLKRQVFRRK